MLLLGRVKAARAKIQDMKLIVNNLAVEYQDQGQGPVILLLHGWGQSLQTFDQLAADLQSDFRVVRLDLPGFGSSQRPQKAWGVGDYARMAEDFARKLNLTVDAAIGHSFGGRIAIVLAARDHLSLRRLVLIDAAGVAKSATTRNMVIKSLAKAGKVATSLPGLHYFQASMRRHLYRAAGSTDYLLAGPMKDIFLKTIHEDLQRQAAKIAVPTLAIWGRDDTETPLSDGQLLVGQIHGVRLEVLEGGHFIYLDQPQQVTQLVREFIS